MKKLLLLCMLIASPLFGATYYADFVDNLGDGSTYAARDKLSDIKASFKDGDVVYVSGTNTGQWSGMTGGTAAYITYYSCEVAYGASDDDPGIVNGTIYITNTTYVKIVGINVDTASTGQCIMVRGSSNTWIEDSSLDTCNNQGISLGAAGYAAQTNVTVKNVTIRNANAENVYIRDTSSFLIYGLDIADGGVTGEGDGIDVKTKSSNGIIDSCTIANSDSNSGVAGITSHAENLTVRNNLISFDNGQCDIGIKLRPYDYGGVDGDNITDGKIYNNIIVGCGEGIRLGGDDGGNTGAGIEIYNNTIIEPTSSAIYFNVNAGDYFTDTDIQNNIIKLAAGSSYVYGLGAGATTTTAITTSEYNDFYDPDGTNTDIFNDAGTARTLTEWRAQYAGQGFDEVGESIQDDPALSAYYLTAGSAAIDAGADLSGTFTTDKDGNTRPSLLAFDMGAYEYQDSAPVVTITAPTSAANYTSYGPSITLGGTATDDFTVASVTWTCDNCTVASGTATGTTAWTQALTLLDGSAVIVVTATDDAAQIGADTITIVYDADPPEPITGGIGSSLRMRGQ